MKRILILLAALCLLLLAACERNTGDPNVYDVEYQGKTYTVDQINQTIAVDGYVCHFKVSGHSSVKFEVTYPNGSEYYFTWSGNVGSGGYSGDYDESRYVSGDTLWEVLEQGKPGAQRNSGHWFIGLLLVGFGVLEAVYPQLSWYLSHGWRYKNAEPSELAMGLGRVTGVIMIIAGIICFFV